MHPHSILERHPELYYADGDVVLTVKQTPQANVPVSSKGPEERPKYTLFRVHKPLLRHHSAAFANFFADASAAPTEVYDGVPLAEMHGDKAEDSALLLSYLYNPCSLVFKRHDPNTPRVVSGVIRLADKYLIEPLHRRLVQQVCDDWPTTLDDFDTLERLPGRSVQFTIRHCDGDPYPGISGPVAAIQFAQEFGCPQILRAAFYRLALAPIARDWYFFQWPPEALATLDKEDLLRYIHGCEVLGSYRPSATQFMCDDCGEPWNVEQGPPVDRACYQYIARLVEVTRDTYRVHGDPLCWLGKCFDHHGMPELSKEHFPRGLCRECGESFFFSV